MTNSPRLISTRRTASVTSSGSPRHLRQITNTLRPTNINDPSSEKFRLDKHQLASSALKSLKLNADKITDELLIHLIYKLRRSKITALDSALEIVEFTKTLISKRRALHTFNDFLKYLAFVAFQLSFVTNHRPELFAMTNLLKHLIYLLPQELNLPIDQEFHKIKPDLIDILQDLKDSLKNSHTDLASLVSEHVYDGQTMLVVGWSEDVLASLETLVEDGVRLTIFVVSGSIATEKVSNEEKNGAKLANKLSSKTEIVFVENSNVFAVMSRVDLILIDSVAVFQDGSALCNVGSKNACLAAFHYAKPVVLLAPSYKLTPGKFENLEQLRNYLSPQASLPAELWCQKIFAVNPQFDIIESDLVTIYLVDQAHNARQIRSLMEDLYLLADIDAVE